MNEIISTFDQEFGQIRKVVVDGQTLWCAKDVATALGLKPKK